MGEIISSPERGRQSTHEEEEQGYEEDVQEAYPQGKMRVQPQFDDGRPTTAPLKAALRPQAPGSAPKPCSPPAFAKALASLIVPEPERKNGPECDPNNVDTWVINLDDDFEEIDRVGEKITVYQSKDSDEQVAVKVFPIEDAHVDIGRMTENFRELCQRLIKLSHPCLLKVRGFCMPFAGIGPRIVTEYVGGGNLREVLMSKSVQIERWWTPNRKAITIAGIVLAMKYVHGKGMVHRDLKPAKILFDDNRNIRIADLADVTISEGDFPVVDAVSSLYVAPEVPGGQYDHKADVYSFGLILYEIATGDRRFSGAGDKMDLSSSLRAGKRPELPDTLMTVTRDLIEVCWSRTPEERPSFDDIWKRIEDSNYRTMPDINQFEVRLFVLWVDEQRQAIKKRDTTRLLNEGMIW
jgi:serine/threonine protein kinase